MENRAEPSSALANALLGVERRPLLPTSMCIFWPSFKLKSVLFSSGWPLFCEPLPAGAFVALPSQPRTLRASLSAMPKSNAGLRSSNPTPSVAFMPPSPCTLTAKKRLLSRACCTTAVDVYGAAANRSPEFVSSNTMSTLMLGSTEVSTTRKREVNICLAVDCVGDVHVDAEKPLLDERGGMEYTWTLVVTKRILWIAESESRGRPVAGSVRAIVAMCSSMRKLRGPRWECLSAIQC